MVCAPHRLQPKGRVATHMKGDIHPVNHSNLGFALRLDRGMNAPTFLHVSVENIRSPRFVIAYYISEVYGDQIFVSHSLYNPMKHWVG